MTAVVVSLTTTYVLSDFTETTVTVVEPFNVTLLSVSFLNPNVNIIF